MNIEAAATPPEAPASNDMSLEAAMAMMDAEQDAEGKPEAKTANEPDAGDAEKAPEQGEEGKADDEAEASVEEQPASSDDPVHTVKINGEDVKVTLSEALKGYSRNEDYKAKTAALADKGRALEGQYATTLQAMADRLLSFDPILSEAQSLDWTALARDDPGEYVAKKAALEQRQQTLAGIEAEVRRVNDGNTAATMQREYELLISAMPQLADPGKAAKFDGELRTYLKSNLKFDDALINGVDDHRFYLLADKARQFDALQTAKASLPAKKIAPTTTVPTVKPGNADAVRSSPRKPSASAPMREQLAWLARNV